MCICCHGSKLTYNSVSLTQELGLSYRVTNESVKEKGQNKKLKDIKGVIFFGLEGEKLLEATES